MPIFGPAHLAMIAAAAASTVLLSIAIRKNPEWARRARLALGSLLAVNELIWYGYRFHTEGIRFPEALPLHLCDLNLWLTVAAAVTLHPVVFEVAYYGGLGGSGMAFLTPDLWAPFPSYPTIYFFVSHGLVVVTLATLSWSGVIRPREGSVWRAYGLLNLYTAAVALFNYRFGTNYMFLRNKPEAASLLDAFGPWPVYILVADLFALLVFWLLWLPVRRSRSRGI